MRRTCVAMVVGDPPTRKMMLALTSKSIGSGDKEKASRIGKTFVHGLVKGANNRGVIGV